MFGNSVLEMVYSHLNSCIHVFARCPWYIVKSSSFTIVRAMVSLLKCMCSASQVFVDIFINANVKVWVEILMDYFQDMVVNSRFYFSQLSHRNSTDMISSGSTNICLNFGQAKLFVIMSINHLLLLASKFFFYSRSLFLLSIEIRIRTV